MSQLDVAAIAKAVQAVLAAQGNAKPVVKAKRNAVKKRGRQKLTDAEKAVFAAKNDADCITAFAAKGYQDVKPRENVLTYKKWFEKGRLVRRGEKAVRVNQFNLFHVSQTDPAVGVIGG